MPFSNPAPRWTYDTVSESVRRHSRWMEILGVVLILLGVFALTCVVLASVATAFLIGAVLLTAGCAQIAASVGYWQRRGGGFGLGVALGVLCLVAGMLCLVSPVRGLRALTFVLGCYFIASGLSRSAVNARMRFPGWGWGATSAVLEILLGILTLVWWPTTSLFLLGTLLGLQLMFSGATALGVGMAVRGILLPKPEPPRRDRPATRFQH